MSSDASRFVSNLPFCQKVGVLPGAEGALALPDDAALHNHVGTVHAGALFTLGEAASGVAIAGVVGELGVVPLAKSASIAYRKPARGALRASGALAEPVDVVAARLAADGKAVADVHVSIADELGVEVATMTVTWHLRRAA